MKDSRYLKIALLGKVHGMHQRGRCNKHLIDSIKEDYAILDITIAQASRIAHDRNNWRTAIKKLPMPV